MKYCPMCSAENYDQTIYCFQCGAPLPEVPNAGGRAKRGSAGKALPVIIILAVVALIAATVVLVPSLFPKLSLGRAVVKTSNAMEKQLDKHSDIVDSIDIVKKAAQNQTFSADLKLSIEDFGEIEGVIENWKSGKALAGVISFTSEYDDYDITASFYADKKEVMFGFPNRSLNYYGFEIKDFSNSIIGKQLLQLVNNSGTSSGLIDSLNGRFNLSSSFRNNLNSFLNSVSIKKLGNRTLACDGVSIKCKAYYLKWDKRALENLNESLSGKAADGSFLSKLISRFEPSCVCYVNNKNQLVGVDFVFAGQEYVFLLKGQDEIWSSFSLDKKTSAGFQTLYTGGLVSSGQTTQMSLSDGTNCLFSAIYNETTGRYSIDVISEGTIASGEFKLNGTKLHFTCTPNLSDMEDVIEVYLSVPKGKPDKLADDYIDITNMGLDGLQRLIIDIGLDLF